MHKKAPLVIHPPGFKKVEIISRTLRGIDVLYIEKYPLAAKSWTDMRSNRPSILIRLGQRGGLSEPRLKRDQPTPRDRYDVGFFNWIPAETELWCFSDNVQFVRDLQIFFDVEVLSSLMGSEVDYSRLNEPRLLVYEPRVTSCAKMLADILIQDETGDQLYGESIMIALLASSFRAIKNPPTRSESGGLLPWQLRLTKEYFEDNFNRAISLDELANLTGLSRSWFARGFRGSTGVAPYAFVLQIRIRKAKELLRDTRIPIALVATQVGFADQSHFTKAFRRLAGTTPHEWRRRISK